jgi:hypothetical protein
MKKLITVLLLTVFSIVSLAQNLVENVNNQVLLTPKKTTKDHLVEAFIEFYDIEVVNYFDHLNIYLVKTGNYGVLANQCQESGLFAIVEKDKLEEIKMDYLPNDPEFTSCWHLKQSSDKDIDADEAWDLLPANNPWVSVAMFDGGLDLSIPDLVGNIDSPFNAVNGTTSIPYANADDKHGTACSGTIAAVTNNGIGVSSVGNNKVKVMPVNIMSAVYAGGSFNTSTSIQVSAVNAAMANPNCVAIAMSYGGSNYSSTLENAFLTARANGRGGKGMMIFASSGNGSSGTAAQYPANYNGVWGVGATSNTDAKASFSNYGQICDISAPGVSIRTTDRLGAEGYDPGDYRSVSGTSFSCPITAAASAVIAYKNWELTDDEILQILSQTCEKTGGYVYTNDPAWPLSTRSIELGYGRINLRDAVVLTPNPGGTPPPPPIPAHNFVVNSLNVTPAIINLGNTITVNYNAATTHPELESVNIKLQHRYSTNAIFGDSDDIIIGVDSAVLGGNISAVAKSFSYTVGGLAGVRYIFITTNYDNAVTEEMTSDNTVFRSFTVNNPLIAGTDVRIELVQPSINPMTTSLQLINVQWRAVNTGTNPITQINWSRRWVNCPTVYGPCTTTIVWTGNLLPGQSTLLPANNAYVCINLCNSTNNCAVPVGGSNTYRADIVSVNGNTGDANLTNNRLDLVFNRISTNGEETLGNDVIIDESISTTEDEVPTSVNIYTVTGMLLDINRYNELPSGIYIIKENYKDHSLTYKWAK